MDTMFPDISVMRYRINAWRVLDDWIVTITAEDDSDEHRVVSAPAFMISGLDIKVHDLLHVVQEIHMEIAASTP